VRSGESSVIRFSFLEPSYLFAIGGLLLFAFVSAGADLGLEAPILVVALVLALQLFVGLISIRLGVISLSRWRISARWPDLLLLGVVGLLASIVVAPVSFVIDQWLLRYGIETNDVLVSADQWLKLMPPEMFKEWTRVVGPTLLLAFLLLVPAGWARRRIAANAPAPPPERAALPSIAETVSEPDVLLAEDKPARIGSCLQRLPAALGSDLIAARSELQYVRIYTTRGDALILGALKDVATERAEEGRVVHRTWWVANEHVRTLRRRGSGYVLTLSNGLDVPVSRRRQSDIVREFGTSTRLG